MNIRTSLLLILATVFTLSACDDDDTYADRLKRERNQISGFLRSGVSIMSNDSLSYILNIPGNIKTISEEEFYAQDSTTNVEKNEYVYFNSTGVYMQIVRKGSGKKIEDGENATILTRYVEYNIARDTLQSSNRSLYYAPYPDVMTCSNSSGLITGRFTSGLMMSLYNSPSVPNGWITPLTFITPGRQDTPEGGSSLVRLIVPSSQGQSDANYNVYPCFYELTYQRGR